MHVEVHVFSFFYKKVLLQVQNFGIVCSNLQQKRTQNYQGTDYPCVYIFSGLIRTIWRKFYLF